jgi:hypothetical protein
MNRRAVPTSESRIQVTSLTGRRVICFFEPREVRFAVDLRIERFASSWGFLAVRRFTGNDRIGNKCVWFPMARPASAGGENIIAPMS